MTKSNLKGIRNTKVEVVAEEKPGFGERLRLMRDRFKLGPHHKMERFSVLLGISLSFLLLITSVSFAGHRAELATLASAQSVISSDFNFSLSGQMGTVSGVYGDEQRKDVMVLFKMANPKDMSADANNYELYITGEKDSMTYEPDVSFALFGSTGYGIIRFQHDEGLKNEILDVTIRSNSNLVGDEVNPSAEFIDESFATHDQAQLFVNPGADEINVLEDVKPGENAPERLYTALVAEEMDAEIRTRIAAGTSKLSEFLNRSEEYRNRLVAAGYKPPATPWFVEGDYVDEDKTFHAAKYLSESHPVDYANHTIWDGYINQVTDGLHTFDAYIADMKAEAQTTAAKEQQLTERVEEVKTVELEDGTVLNLSDIKTGESPSAQIAAKDSVNSLVSVWRSYLSQKEKLQRDLMLELLVLDADVLSQPSLYSENSNDNLATFY